MLSNPLLIKKRDPAAAAFAATKLPGVVDCIAHEKTQRVELARVVAEHNAIHAEKHVALEATVSNNKAAGDGALAVAYATLWRYFAKQQWQLMQEYTEQRLDFDKQFQTLREEHARDSRARRCVWHCLNGVCGGSSLTDAKELLNQCAHGFRGQAAASNVRDLK